MPKFDFFARADEIDKAAGFRDGPRGTHSSRTLMLDELDRLLGSLTVDSDPKFLIIEENVLGKLTEAGRKLSFQRLRELYGLERSMPLFRAMLRLRARDGEATHHLALLVGLARDPLLRATARAVLGLAPGSELMRDTVRHAVVGKVGTRLNPSILDKVIRNAASSWTQTGHLQGRTFKRRSIVKPSVAAFAFAAWVASKSGFAGVELLDNAWMTALDLTPDTARAFAARAQAAGLIAFRIFGNSFEIDVSPIDRLVREET
jgi:hypothetical protein